MERRSKRLESLPLKSVVEDGGDGSDGSDVERPDTSEAESSVAVTKKNPRPKRRRKISSTNVAAIQTQIKKFRGKRGLLRDVVDMPMDVLYEVCDV